MRADFNANATADTALFNDRFIQIGKLETDSGFAQRTGHDTGAANTSIHPRIAGRAIDLCDAHVNIAFVSYCECIGWANLHAFTAQGATFLARVYERRIQATSTFAMAELYALRRTNLAAQPAADTSRIKSGRVL